MSLSDITLAEVVTSPTLAAIDLTDPTASLPDESLQSIFVAWYGFQRYRRTFAGYVRHDDCDVRAQWFDMWFAKDPAVDAAIGARFQNLLPLFRTHVPNSLVEALGLIVLYDQIPRNVFRGHVDANKYDAIALAHARALLPACHDGCLPLYAVITVTLSFVHSEDMADQGVAAALQRGLARRFPCDPLITTTLLRIVHNHNMQVEAFGRLPARCLATGSDRSPLTEAELAFLRAVTPANPPRR